MNVPQLRFKGFNEEWQDKKLNKLTIVKDGTHESPKFYSKGYPLVTSKNLNNGKIDFSNCQFISKTDYDNFNKRSRVECNDILMSMIGTIGNIVKISKKDILKLFSIKNVALIKDKNKLNNYLIYYLQTSNIKLQFFKNLTGGTQQFIALGIIRDLDIKIPSINEQQKIGTFFSKLDDLITKQTQKVALLKQLKRGYLQKLFPQAEQTTPQLRFKGFNDEWQSKKLNTMFDFYKGKGLSIQQLNGTKYPAIIYGELYTKYHEIINTVFSKSDSSGFLGYKNDLLFPGSSTVANGTAQTNALMVDNVQLGGDIIIARPKQNNVNSVFMSYQINSQRTNLYPIIVGTTITHMYGKDLSKLKFMITNLSEQQKIGSLFAKLDHLIELQNHKLELLQELKKGYLQKMFV